MQPHNPFSSHPPGIKSTNIDQQPAPKMATPTPFTAVSEVFDIPELMGLIFGHCIALERSQLDAEQDELTEPDLCYIETGQLMPYYPSAPEVGSTYVGSVFETEFDADHPLSNFSALHAMVPQDFGLECPCYCPSEDSRTSLVSMQYLPGLLRLRQVNTTFRDLFDADVQVQRSLGRRLALAPSDAPRVPEEESFLRPYMAVLYPILPARIPILDFMACSGCPTHAPLVAISNELDALHLEVFCDPARRIHVVLSTSSPSFSEPAADSAKLHCEGAWRKILLHTDATAPDIELLYIPDAPSRERLPYAPGNLIPLATFSARDGHTLGGFVDGISWIFRRFSTIENAMDTNIPRHTVLRYIEELQAETHKVSTWVDDD